ncbi:helix-turn-helix domain-containing protein [Paenibacillus sp. V4I7]|uniref:helix-turn-helix domain-containing protein n=1 Tax=Paenibacillus sp. V4I7 TaxID=3042307 RepID=UPI002784DCAE|nr:helix-turn-helix transcriptional regulator [Paenibacillus sp. V4I7]MDQ0899951.1 transcriptional regulator with XRE-family HTH domain [Paenibacillus sp. V4I7]
MSSLFQQVGKRIRFYRKARKLTQEQLAESIPIDQAHLVRIERGSVNITLETIEKISRALEIHPNLLFETEKSRYIDREDLEKIQILLFERSNEDIQRVHSILKEIFFIKESK